MRHTLPDPRPLLGPLRALESAETSIEVLADGRYRATIAHAPLMGVTPSMLVWFLRNMSRTLEFEGLRIQLYLWWHPFDHMGIDVVRPAPDGGRWGGGGVSHPRGISA